MLRLLRLVVTGVSASVLLEALDPGAGHPPAEAKRRRWVRNLWVLVLPCLWSARDHLDILIVLTIFAFVVTFMILDEMGRG